MRVGWLVLLLVLVLVSVGVPVLGPVGGKQGMMTMIRARRSWRRSRAGGYTVQARISTEFDRVCLRDRANWATPKKPTGGGCFDTTNAGSDGQRHKRALVLLCRDTHLVESEGG